MESPAFSAHKQSAARYFSAVVRARIVITTTAQTELIAAQDAMHDMGGAAQEAAWIDKPDHQEKLVIFTKSLEAARDKHNDFMLAVIAHLETLRQR